MAAPSFHVDMRGATWFEAKTAWDYAMRWTW